MEWSSEFPFPQAVLLYAAEDALHIVRRRFDGICEAAVVALTDLDIRVITAPTLASISRPIATASPRPVLSEIQNAGDIRRYNVFNGWGSGL
jgi:hypothetical protein